MKIPPLNSSTFSNPTEAVKKSSEQLASGKRVNSAADDAATLEIINRLNSQQLSSQQSIRNGYDAISYSQTAESALATISDAVSRIETLSVQAGNGALTDGDRQSLQGEVEQLQAQITKTLEDTTFAGSAVFTGQSVQFQVGTEADAAENLTVTDGGFAAALTTIDISTAAGAQAAFDITQATTEEVNEQRAELGAFQNGIASRVKQLGSQADNIAASQSRIQDTDYAQAVSDQVANDILSQASVALRGQANQSASSVLGLL